jgi:hypothetical protein
MWKHHVQPNIIYLDLLRCLDIKIAVDAEDIVIFSSKNKNK